MHEFDPDRQERPSKSARKRDADTYKDLARTLTEVPAARLARAELPADLAEAVALARRLRRGPGRKRQMLFIAKQLRQLGEVEAIRAAVDPSPEQQAAALRQERRLDARVASLLAEGDPALSALLDQHPHVDRQQLRQLLRAARKEQAADEDGPWPQKRALRRFLHDHGLD